MSAIEDKRPLRARSLWRELPAPHRRWIWRNGLLATACINLVVNGAIAWLSLAGERRVPLWSVPLVQQPGTIVDTLGTLFLLPLITCLLASAAVRHDARLGRLPPLKGLPAGAAGLARLPSALPARAVTLGALCTLVLGPIAIAVLAGTDFADLGPGQFVLYKAILGVVLGAIVTPAIALRAMLEEPARKSRPGARLPAPSPHPLR